MTEDLPRINHNNIFTDDVSVNKLLSNIDQQTVNEKNDSSSEDDNEILFTKTKSKLKRVTQSDSDNDKENDLTKGNFVLPSENRDSDNSSDGELFFNKKKSRIRKVSNSDSEPPLETDNIEVSSKYDLTRTKIKGRELQDKFKKLKHPKRKPKENTQELSLEVCNGEESDYSSDGDISKIKQKSSIKKLSHSLKSICDPDTSDEETNVNLKLQKSKPKKTKLISPKPIRMSAKQAMENMQKIKSESNRMLREKEVSLPYHRPKALTLKDIMNRRKPAITSDGKSLPIKMNNEQLKQYALMLEQRQKEMMELCKSDTDEEQNSAEEQDSANKCNNKENSGDEITLDQESSDLSGINDKTFDDINMENNMIESKSFDEQKDEEATISETLDNVSEKIENNNPVYHKNANIETNKIVEKQRDTMEVSVSNENVVLPLDVLDKSSIEPEDENSAENLETDVYSKEEEQLKDFKKSIEQENQAIPSCSNFKRTKDEICDTEGSQSKSVQEANNVESEDKIKNNISNTSDTKNKSDEFSDDDDFCMEELEKIIENVNTVTSNKILPNIEARLDLKPTLTGTPGMVIDLDNDSEETQQKLTGVELLKERFKYFAKLKSLEEMEKDREKKFKPGIQHLKLKQQLEEQIAEQRSLEWEKRIQVENQLKMEMNELEGEEFDGDEIEKIEAKLEEADAIYEEEESSSEEEIEDTDVYESKEKPRIRNPLIEDEAEVSEDEEINTVGDRDEENDGADDNDGDDSDNDSEDDEDSSQSEEEQQTKCKKGRILKAFEDSDDEESKSDPVDNASESKHPGIRESQDDEIQLAQPEKTHSEDLFSSQEFTQKSSNVTDENKVADKSLEELGSQTFSILKTGSQNIEPVNDYNNGSSEKFDVIFETQPSSVENFEAIVGMCTGGFSDNLITPEAESSQLSQSQEIGDDVAASYTGKFNDNPFTSQAAEVENNTDKNIEGVSIYESNSNTKTCESNTLCKPDDFKTTNAREGENILLKSILDELNDPEFESPKPNKYFFNATKSSDKDKSEIDNNQFKKKFVIESDDEMIEDAEICSKKKKKKRKLENRALQISDDEEECSEREQETHYESDIEQDSNKIVEYDSEENEIEVQAKVHKKKRAGRDFFEQEAELTSEDEWVGSGDEDEAGLDRMEREEGDDDTFHQGKLQRQLGEIHMREVLDQDKREVRMIQELLFEDGDLGDGHRQRKFRWKNADGDEELGTNADEYADTQEDEFESEEQWRKQRHERDMFLRKLQEKDEEANVRINRSALIKASLAAKPSSPMPAKTSLSENNSDVDNRKSLESTEKKTTNIIPSPKSSFIILQQNYHNSLLTRGRGALARLAALATPLAGDGDDAPKVNASSNRGNFVFAAITPTENRSKAIKRQAETTLDPPRLLKRMKESKNSLLDHL